MKTIHIKLDEDTHKQLRKTAFDREMTMQDYVVATLTDDLGSLKGQPLGTPTKVSSAPVTEKVVAPPEKNLTIPPEVSQEFKRETHRERLDREEKERLRKRWNL